MGLAEFANQQSGAVEAKMALRIRDSLGALVLQLEQDKWSADPSLNLLAVPGMVKHLDHTFQAVKNDPSIITY